MENQSSNLRSILTPSLRLFLAGEFFIKFSDMYGLFLPLLMSEMGASVVDIGLVYTLSDIVPLALNIIGGWLSDRFGRLRTITWGNILRLLSFAVMFFANQWEWMILVFSLIGMGWALGGPSFAAFIADNTAEENRAKVYAVQHNVQNVINLSRYPLAGLIVARFSYKTMILVAAIFFIIGTIILAVLERMSQQKQHQSDIKSDNIPFKKSFGLMIALVLAGGLFTWLFIIDHANDIFVGLSNTLSVIYFKDVVGVSVEQIGYLPTIGAIIAFFVTIPLGYWVDKKGENVGMGLAYFLLALHFAFPLIARNFLGLIPSALVYPFMMGLAVPASKSLISKAVPEEQRGIAFGLTLTSRGLVSLPSPYLGGLLWDRFNPRTPFLVTVIGCLGLSVLAFLKLKIPKEKELNAI
jgi:MFS family permease